MFETLGVCLGRWCVFGTLDVFGTLGVCLGRWVGVWDAG